MSFDLGSVSVDAAARARDALVTAGRTPTERGMAAVAKQAIFTEALLGAIRARIGEFKTVAK